MVVKGIYLSGEKIVLAKNFKVRKCIGYKDNLIQLNKL